MSYSIPIISNNLNKQETIVQIAEVLNHLTKITEDVFQQVSERIAINNKALLNISGRVDVVNTKIARLKGAKKATQVFSSSKYPATDVNRQYVSIFDDVKPIEFKRHKLKYKNSTPSYERLEKLQVFHVKVPNTESKEKLNGLGNIPVDIKCMNDLLLYNSGKNLYKNFVMSDALKGPQNIREEDTIDKSAIGAAPYSMSERSTLTRSSTAQSYFYTPKIGQVPALDVPLDLPDLPGIADDLRYINNVEPPIAPSATTTPNIADLPPIDIIKTTDKEPDVTLPTPPPPPPPVELAKPPPIPSETVSLPESKQIEQVKLPVPPSPPAPTPPPPPPLPPPIAVEPSPAAVPPSASTPYFPTPADPRANLMEAIRKAGGSKNAKLRKSELKETKAKTQAPSGDLMADLHSKLLMRRKGISGSKKQEENQVDAVSTLSRLSAMIPPPGPKNDIQESTATEDEDWED